MFVDLNLTGAELSCLVDTLRDNCDLRIGLQTMQAIPDPQTGLPWSTFESIYSEKDSRRFLAKTYDGKWAQGRFCDDYADYSEFAGSEKFPKIREIKVMVAYTDFTRALQNFVLAVDP
jgi:hypothetical protein